MTPWLFSAVVIAVSALALRQRSTIGWIVAAVANAVAAWLLWMGQG